MKVCEISPIHGVEFKKNSTRKIGGYRIINGEKVSSWNIKDVQPFDAHVRERIVTRYLTELGRFVSVDNTGWYWVPTSVGHGSVSDQKGLNQFLRGTGWIFRRDGKDPRYELKDGTGWLVEIFRNEDRNR